MDPWERQSYDTEESWPIFLVYRDQTPPRRGLLVTIKGRPVDPIKVSRWFREHYWEARCAEYDRHLDAIRIGEREALLRQSSAEVAAEHMGILAYGRDIIRREFEKLAATVHESAGEVVRPRDLIRLAETVVKLDRLVRGESTEAVAVDGPDLSKLSDSDLAALSTILDQASKP